MIANHGRSQCTIKLDGERYNSSSQLLRSSQGGSEATDRLNMYGFQIHFIDVGSGSTTVVEYKETEESGMVKRIVY